MQERSQIKLIMDHLAIIKQNISWNFHIIQQIFRWKRRKSNKEILTRKYLDLKKYQTETINTQNVPDKSN